MGIKKDIPREEIPWYPEINYQKCTGCQACLEHCSNNVYEWNQEEEKVEIVNPYNCVVGCSGCYSKCPVEAIKFPPLTILAEFME